MNPLNRHLTCFLAATALCCASAFGFEAVLKINPPVIELSESALLTLEVRGAKNPQLPTLPGVPGLTITPEGTSQQSTWINGRADSFIAYNFRVYPQQTGEFTLGPITCQADGKTQTVSATQLRVTAAGGNAQSAQSWNDVLFARLDATRETVYTQEPVELTLSVFSRPGIQLSGNIGLQGMPETGLTTLEWQEEPPGREEVGGTLYEVRRFRTVGRALNSGTFRFAPRVTLQVVVPNRNGRSRSPFDDPFFGSLLQRNETRPVELPVEPLELNVRPLPEAGRPAGFSGAVGRFTFQASAQPQEVAPGDPVTLTMTLSGNGHWEQIAPPTFPDTAHFRLYGETIRRIVNNTLQFEQVISPKDSQTTGIPPVEFSYFDTESGVYRTVRSAPIALTVRADTNRTAMVFAANEVPVPRPFATESEVQRITSALETVWCRIRPLLWILPAGLATAIAFFGLRRWQRWRQSDTVRIRRQAAPKAARKALHAATQARKNNAATTFYNALGNALADYFGNRLNLPPGAVTPAETLQALALRGAGSEPLESLRTLYMQIEARRYGQTAEESPEQLAALQHELERLLKQFEKTVL